MADSKEQPKPCDGCPWISKEPRDVEALTDDVRQAANAGTWFCCHIKLGTCWGAVRFGAAETMPTTNNATSAFQPSN